MTYRAWKARGNHGSSGSDEYEEERTHTLRHSSSGEVYPGRSTHCSAWHWSSTTPALQIHGEIIRQFALPDCAGRSGQIVFDPNHFDSDAVLVNVDNHIARSPIAVFRPAN